MAAAPVALTACLLDKQLSEPAGRAGLPSDARRRGNGPLEGDFLGAIGAHAPSELELLVAPWAEFTELCLAVRTEHVLRIDRLAAAGARPQLARGTARLRERLRLQLERPALRHRQRRPDDHVDEKPEDKQHPRT